MAINLYKMAAYQVATGVTTSTFKSTISNLNVDLSTYNTKRYQWRDDTTTGLALPDGTTNVTDTDALSDFASNPDNVTGSGVGGDGVIKNGSTYLTIQSFANISSVYTVEKNGVTKTYNVSMTAQLLSDGTVLLVARDSDLQAIIDAGYVRSDIKSITTGNDFVFANSRNAANFDQRMPICYVVGEAFIETDRGVIDVGDLRLGDRVLTMDHGYQEIVWVGASRALVGPGKRAVRIRANALGRNVPNRDLVVSPQHRILINSPIVDRVAGSPAVLVAAKSLVGKAGIAFADDLDEVVYVHFLCPHHEIVFANGTPSETLYPGPMAMQSLVEEARQEIETLFPELRSETVPARPLISVRIGKKILERHVKNRKDLTSLLET